LQVSLSVCLIIKNEEKNLLRCLFSIKNIASQIIVVDTGSTDSSLLIARELTDQVYYYKWNDDFSSARNFCLDKADGDWILVLDGDEELESKCLCLIKEIIQTQDIEAYMVTIKNYYKNNHELMTIMNLQPRLFRNNKRYRYKGIVREQILESIQGCNSEDRIKIVQDISIIHYGYIQDETENRHRLKRNIDLINQAFDKDEEAAVKHFYLGQEYYRHYRFAEALEHFLFVYEQDEPQADYFPDLLRSISISLYMLNRVAESLSFIDKSLNMLPDMGDLYYVQAVIYKHNSEYKKAYQSYKECLTVLEQPLHYSSIYCQHKDKIYFYIGGLAEYFMDKDNALIFFLEALKHNPYMLDSLRRIIAIINPRLNPEYTIESLNRVFDLSDRALQAEIAVMFYEEGAYQLALNIINQIEKSGPISDYSRLIKGLCLLRNKQYSNAEEELQIINNELYIVARQYLLIYYWLKQDYRKAIEYFKDIKNVESKANITYVLNLLINGYADKTNKLHEHYGLAREIVELVVEIGDNDQIDEAFQNLSSLLGVRPSRFLAETFFKYEKYELAEKEFCYLLKIDYSNAQASYYLGKTLWARGDLHGAEKYLRYAIGNGLNTPKLRWEIARLYQELTITNLREGLNYCPDNEAIQILIKELEEKLLEV